MIDANHQMTVDNVILKILSDIRGITNMEEIRLDPIGNSIYLYFLLKNRKRGYEVESLINWMNEWINKILVKEKVSRALDVEITSAIFGYHSLKKYNKLMIKIQPVKINKFLLSYFHNGHFFQNFGLSALIGIGIHDVKEDMNFFLELIEWLKSQIFEETVLRDGKNVLFSYLLFKEYKEINRMLYEYSYEKVIVNDVLFSEELYYSYVLWLNRKMKDNILLLKKIRQFVNDSIKNAGEYVKNTDSSRVSKIYKGTLIDFLNEYERTTFKVSKEELSLDELSRIVILSPIISIILSSIGTYIGFLLKNGTIDNFIALYYGPYSINKIAMTGAHTILYIIIFSLYLISGSIFWDVIYKKIVRGEIIKSNIKARLKNKVVQALIISPSAIISILEKFF